MVIFEVRNSDGFVRRCDGRCYNATGTECACICGGVNHGVGEKVAREDREYLSDQDILSNSHAPAADKTLTVTRPPLQMELF